ncbi:aminoacyl-tRNA hydrolase [Desulfuromonas sp. DDH964]|uniref:aminoacyl-tRNA hydrolase n=1 Tax=Desulfuromonas sp. DDH964 TaxID=1823759 RepID=UPI001E3D80AD|nr:aminoacyl-tRNA hydrolase [Desulfuromonas sp. DDH964]
MPRKSRRSESSPMMLVAGLGNPGERYAATRHNVGFMVVQRLAAAHGLALKKKGHQGVYGTGRIAGIEATLLLPLTFMNLSGASVGSACKSLGVEPGDLIVVHDEIDLPFGALRIKAGGGHGGHNGLRSICGNLGSGEFLRLRIGVGRPPQGGDVAGYVLNPFSARERGELDQVLAAGVAALETLLVRGAAAAMNEFNNRAFASPD